MNILFFSSNSYPGGVTTFFKQFYLHKEIFGANMNFIFATQAGNPVAHLLPPETKKWDLLLDQKPYRNPKYVRFIWYKCISAMKKIWKIIKRPYIKWKNFNIFKEKLAEEKIDCIVVNSGGYAPDLWTELLKAGEKCNIKNSYLIMHSYPNKRVGIVNNVKGLCFDLFIKRKASNIITVSHFCAETIQEISKVRLNIDVIYNGIDKVGDGSESKDDKRRDLLKQGYNNEFLIGMTALFFENKGQIYFIKLIEELLKRGHKNIKAVIIGTDADAAYYTQCMNYIIRHELESFIEVRKDITDAARYAECFDVAIIPSVGVESFGLVCLEAMMYGVPIVGFETGGIPEIVLDSDTGYLVTVKDYQKMADNVERLMDDPALYQKMSERSGQRWAQMFTSERMCENYLKYFRDKLHIEQRG